LATNFIIKSKSSSSASAVYIVTASQLNVRSGPARTYTSLGYVTKGQKLSVISKQSNGWYKINFKDKTGFVSGKYV
jgi:uncharacterized protein YgiM (DUF1202 family)